MKKYVMALDEGTTSSRCILFNKHGEIESLAQKEFSQIFPQPGWVEHDPVEIWSSMLEVMKKACEDINADIDEIASIGITNQRETTIVWDKDTGLPVYNAIVWQCRRTADIVEAIEKDMLDYIQDRTGLIPDAYFSATKIKWILDNVEGARKKAEDGRLLFGTVETWLMWKLSGGKIFATDYTNASRTMLFDIKKLKWDEKLLQYFDIPSCMMPKAYPSGNKFGFTEKSVLGKPVPICAAAGDQQSSLFGLLCTDKGDAKNTYGTGCFLLMNTGKTPIKSTQRLITTICCGFDENVDYAIEGSVFIGGASVQWLRDEMKIIKSSGETEEIIKNINDTAGAYIVPAFTGLGAPYWNQNARGTIVGITRGFNRHHLVRAVLESMAYQVYDVLTAMEKDAGVKINHLKADGGASRNNFLMEFQAGLLNADIIRPEMLENTALGAAYLAGIVSGFWKSPEDLKNNMSDESIFCSNMTEEKRSLYLSGWHKAIAAALFWAEQR